MMQYCPLSDLLKDKRRRCGRLRRGGGGGPRCRLVRRTQQAARWQGKGPQHREVAIEPVWELGHQLRARQGRMGCRGGASGAVEPRRHTRRVDSRRDQENPLSIMEAWQNRQRAAENSAYGPQPAEQACCCGDRTADRPAAGRRPTHVLRLGGRPLLAANGQVGQDDGHARRPAALDRRLRAGMQEATCRGVRAGKRRWHWGRLGMQGRLLGRSGEGARAAEGANPGCSSAAQPQHSQAGAP